MKDWIVRNLRNGWLLEAGAVVMGLGGAYLNRRSREQNRDESRSGRGRFLPQ